MALILSEQANSFLNLKLQILPPHLPLVDDVDILKVAQLVSYFVVAIVFWELSLNYDFLVDGLEQGILQNVVEGAHDSLQVYVNFLDVVLNLLE